MFIIMGFWWSSNVLLSHIVKVYRIFLSNFDVFLAHLAKGNMSFYHHLASVVCRQLTFHILIFSSETPHQMNWNLVGSIYGRSFINIGHFVPIH